MKSTLRANKGFIVFMLLFGVFRTAIADWNPIPSGSMRPGLLEGDVVFVNRLAFNLKGPLTNVVLAHTGGHAQARHEVLREVLSRLRGRGRGGRRFRCGVCLRLPGAGLRWCRRWIDIVHGLWRRLRGCRLWSQASRGQRLLDGFGGGGRASAHQLAGCGAHLRQHVLR